MGRERHDFPDFNRDPPRLDGGGSRSSPLSDAPKPERDWKRSVLIFGLGALSWVATYVGMLELIEANMGDLPLVHKVIIGFSVAMLMTMIIWLLDQLFKPHAVLTKSFYAFGYVFLSLISVGFGFGFYWKVLESRGEASRSAESAVSQVQGSLHAASTRLTQLQATLVQLTQVSSQKAELERTKGTSCPNSKPGDGPRRKLREEDAQRFAFSSDLVKSRVGAVDAEMATLNGDLNKIVTNDASTIDPRTGNRNEFMRALSRKLDLTVTGFNAFRTDPQLKQLRTDLADRAERTTFADSRGGSFACPDPQLQTALRGVVKAIDQLPELEKPQIAAVEGSEATIEAFRRLTATLVGALSFKMPPSADELRDLQKKAVQSVESAPAAENARWNAEQGGLSKRDYVPLAVALFVDLCLFLVSMVQRPATRLAGLVPKMQAAERGPVIEILSRFNEIHRDQQIRDNFEIFRHVVFDMHGDYYVAVPLDAPPRLNPAEREELRVEAQLLANLFSSFEKERIFKRTMLPTTSSVQKRLKRQGSKFAGAEAFRVYKFTDGSWSDIILGAVMGAARRIENEKRPFPRAHERPALDQTKGLSTPANDASLARPVPAPSAMLTGQRVPRPPEPATRDFIPPQAQAPAQAPPRSSPSFAPGARPATSGAAPMRPPAPPASQANESAPRRAPEPPTLSLDPDHVARFGPYASAYALHDRPPQAPRVPRPAPRPEEAEVTVKPAACDKDRNAVPDAAPVAESTVVVALRSEPAARIEPAAGMVDVTLARETATFSVPVSELNAPGSLKSALAKAGIAKVAEAEHELPAPPLLLEADDMEDEPVEEIGKDPLSDKDLAIISRMAPPAAE